MEWYKACAILWAWISLTEVEPKVFVEELIPDNLTTDFLTMLQEAKRNDKVITRMGKYLLSSKNADRFDIPNYAWEDFEALYDDSHPEITNFN